MNKGTATPPQAKRKACLALIGGVYVSLLDSSKKTRSTLRFCCLVHKPRLIRNCLIWVDEGRKVRVLGRDP
jgi:hypothetical protein